MQTSCDPLSRGRVWTVWCSPPFILSARPARFCYHTPVPRPHNKKLWRTSLGLPSYCRVLVEVATTMEVTMEAFMDGVSVYNLAQVNYTTIQTVACTSCVSPTNPRTGRCDKHVKCSPPAQPSVSGGKRTVVARGRKREARRAGRISKTTKALLYPRDDGSFSQIVIIAVRRCARWAAGLPSRAPQNGWTREFCVPPLSLRALE